VKVGSWTTDIERITSRSRATYSVSRFILLLFFVWFLSFGLYVVAFKGLDIVSGGKVSGDVAETRDQFMLFYGLGMILATAVTPLFCVYFLLDALDSYSKDRGLVREFLKVRSIREARRKLEKGGESREAAPRDEDGKND